MNVPSARRAAEAATASAYQRHCTYFLNVKNSNIGKFIEKLSGGYAQLYSKNMVGSGGQLTLHCKRFPA
jgi:hypothetical protein